MKKVVSTTRRYSAPRILSKRRIRVSLNGKRNDPEFEMLLAALKS